MIPTPNNARTTRAGYRATEKDIHSSVFQDTHQLGLGISIAFQDTHNSGAIRQIPRAIQVAIQDTHKQVAIRDTHKTSVIPRAIQDTHQPGFGIASNIQQSS